MAESITVNGVVFEWLGSGGGAIVYQNGETLLVRNDKTKQWDARMHGKMSRLHHSAGAALSDLADRVREWQIVGIELARLGIGGSQ
jgi:UDP-N-acetylenolpyruvoylglucosamine reductase